MRYFDNTIYENALRINPVVAAYVKVLMHYGVAGFEKTTIFHQVRHFLTDWIKFEDNGSDLIWHVDIEPAIRNYFKKISK